MELLSMLASRPLRGCCDIASYEERTDLELQFISKVVTVC